MIFVLKGLLIGIGIILVIITMLAINKLEAINKYNDYSLKTLVSHSFQVPATISDISYIEPWMTFAYVNHIFNVPDSYLAETLDITDTRYPRLVIGRYASMTKRSHEKNPFRSKIGTANLSRIDHRFFNQSMTGLASVLLSFILISKYWALFVIIFSASVIVPIPANVVLVAMGAFVSQGYVGFIPSFVVAVVAACCGDWFDFFIARRFGRGVLRHFGKRATRALHNMERYMERYPALTIILSRFGGLTDSPVNLLSGLTNLRFYSFFLFDLLGNLLSQSAFLYLGYALSANWQDFTGFFNAFGWLIAGIVVAIFLLASGSKKSDTEETVD